MRTTLTIDDDVLVAARQRARRERRTAGQVLSQLARQALTADQGATAAPVRHGFAVLPRRGAPVTNELVDHLRDDED